MGRGRDRCSATGAHLVLAVARPPDADLGLHLFSDPVLLATTHSSASGSIRATVTVPANTALGVHKIGIVDSAGRVSSPLTSRWSRYDHGVDLATPERFRRSASLSRRRAASYDAGCVSVDADRNRCIQALGLDGRFSCFWHPHRRADGRRCLECPLHRHYCIDCLIDTGHGLLCTQHEAQRARGRRRRLQALVAAALVAVAWGVAVLLLARSPATGSAGTRLDAIFRPPPEGAYFAENRAGNWDVFYLFYATRAERRLTNNPAQDLDPANNFSNFGLLLFSSNRDNGDFEIYSMGRDGTGQTRLTAVAGADRHPDWSPWQSHIVFESNRHGAEDLYVMSADGSEQTRITNAPGYDGQPQWTSNVRVPVGGTDARTDIAFVSDRDEDLEIYLIKPDGSDLRRLTFSPGGDQLPAWSPDAAKIAFISDRDGNREIYVMNADGSGQTRLTHHPGADDSPTWSPVGDRINFRSDRGGGTKSYSMKPDGSDQSLDPNQR